MKNEDKKIDVSKINEMVILGKNILKIIFAFLCIMGFYILTLVIKEWKVLDFILTLLRILSPLFIGVIISWVLRPLVTFLQKRGINKKIGTILIYVMFLGVIYYIFTVLFPILINQMGDFTKTLPSILEQVTIWLNGVLNVFKDMEFIDINTIKYGVVDYITYMISSLSTDIPNIIINLLSTFGIIALGLMIGFYLLISEGNIIKPKLSMLPLKFRQETIDYFDEVNDFLFNYLKGVMFICAAVFLFSSLGFYIIGVDSALLLGLICGVTNVIPYAGPFIGGSVAVVVAFTNSYSLGITTIVLIVIVQTLESMILQPLVMSKTMKLRPVTILIGLLIFGYFFGIIGMIFATPTIAVLKTTFTHFNKKYDIYTK